MDYKQRWPIESEFTFASAYYELTAILHSPCGPINLGPVNDQCCIAQKMTMRCSTCSVATDNGDDATSLKHSAIKQEEAPPILCMSDIDTEEEAIWERISRC